MELSRRLGFCWLPWVQPMVERVLRQRDLAPRVRERLEMVKAATLGQDLAQIARWSGRSPRRVAHWLRQFAAGGVAAVADAPRPGRPVRATAAYRAALEHAMETGPRRSGCPTTAGPPSGSAPISPSRRGARSPQVGCVAS